MANITQTQQQNIDAAINENIYLKGLFYPESGLLTIAKKLGLEVYLANFKEGVSGLINRGEGNETPKIYLNKSDTKERRTFTLAHELGHYFLHKGEKLRVDKYNYNENSKEAKEESEANYFAGSLLMPKEKFLEVLVKTSNTSLIAEYFGVSEPAVITRMRWLRKNQ